MSACLLPMSSSSQGLPTAEFDDIYTVDGEVRENPGEKSDCKVFFESDAHMMGMIEAECGASRTRDKLAYLETMKDFSESKRVHDTDAGTELSEIVEILETLEDFRGITVSDAYAGIITIPSCIIWHKLCFLNVFQSCGRMVTPKLSCLMLVRFI